MNIDIAILPDTGRIERDIFVPVVILIGTFQKKHRQKHYGAGVALFTPAKLPLLMNWSLFAGFDGYSFQTAVSNLFQRKSVGRSTWGASRPSAPPRRRRNHRIDGSVHPFEATFCLSHTIPKGDGELFHQFLRGCNGRFF
jgi:hypothetical protein